MNYGIILAAGSGSRFGSLKQFEKINNKELFLHSIYKFLNSKKIYKIIIVVNSSNYEQTKKIIEKEKIDLNYIEVVVGGETRFLSLINGISFIYNNSFTQEDDNIIVHDAARPNFHPSSIEKIIDALVNFEVVTLGYKITDALKKARKIGSSVLIESDIDREDIWAVTTPQGFKLKLFKEILEKIKADEKQVIRNIYDETSLFLENKKVLLIEDTRYNIKITYKEDLEALQKIMSE